MLFCQLGHARSLSEITGGLAACEGKLVHLGVKTPPKEPTLAFANKHRPWEIYRDVFEKLYQRCADEALHRSKRKFRGRNLYGDLPARSGRRGSSLRPEPRPAWWMRTPS